MERTHRIGAAVLLVGLLVLAFCTGGAVQAAPGDSNEKRLSDFDVRVSVERIKEFGLDQDDVMRQVQWAISKFPKTLSDEQFLEALRHVALKAAGGKQVLLGEIAGVKPKPTVTARIGVQLDQEKLDAFKLTAQEVSKQIRQQIKALTMEELNKVIITTPDGRKVKLSQIATFEVQADPGKTQPKTEPKDDPGEGVRPVPLDQPADAPAGKVALAVVPFHVLGNIKVKDAGAILAERLLPFFAEKYQLVDQAQLQQFRDQDALTMADLVALADPSKKPAGKAVKLRAVKVLVVGSLSAAPDGLTITARLSDWQSGQVKGLAVIRASDWESLMGRLPYLASKLTGQSLAATQAMVPYGELEFRVVPNQPDSDNEPSLSEAEIQAMLQRLAKGPYTPAPADKYVWAELKGEGGGGFVMAKHRGKQLVLLCNQAKYTMPAGLPDDLAWYVERSTAGVDSTTSQPNVAIRLDRRGAARMGALTKANVGNRLAIVIDGKVVSAPVVRSELSRDAVITGNFAMQDAKDLAAAIAQTMRRPPAEKDE